MRNVGTGRVLGLVGAAVVVVASLLDWTKETALGTASNAFDAPVTFLFDWENADDDGLSVGVLLLLIALVVVVGAVLFRARPLVVVGGVLAGATAFLFVYQVHALIDDNNVPLSLSDVVGIGPYVGVAGAAVAVVGGVLSFVQPRRA